MRRVLMMMAACLLLVLVYPLVVHGQDIKLKINEVHFPSLKVVENTSWVPIRPFLTDLGCEIIWYPETETVVLGSRLPAALVLDVPVLLIDGIECSYSTGPSPTMMNGQLHLPVRDLVQILDLGLHWKEETSTAFVEWKGAKKTISAADLDIFYKENRTAIDSLHKSKPKPIGKYTTYFNKFNKNRTENIHLACKRLNNTVVKPGEIFSFNRATGPRGAANGYKESIIFKGGKKVLEAGGGVCQVSSTLYNAALDAGMKIVERHPHSLYVDYVPVNKDATVYYGYLDFKFKNTTPHCIQVRGDVIGNQLTASLNKIPCPYDPLQ